MTPEQTDKFKNQILIVLADYQSMRPSTCPQCHKPRENESASCEECGYKHVGFSQTEGIRIEVADRILANMKIIEASGKKAPKARGTKRGK
jgi:hypothetical protein